MDICPITIWREASGEGAEGMLAVAFSIHNRATSGRRMWPADPEKVCLQRKQYSCWNDSDATRDKWPAATDPVYLEAQDAWQKAITGAVVDPTGGAFYYVNPDVIAANPFANAQYVETAVIGKHHFYREA